MDTFLFNVKAKFFGHIFSKLLQFVSLEQTLLFKIDHSSIYLLDTCKKRNTLLVEQNYNKCHFTILEIFTCVQGKILFEMKPRVKKSVAFTNNRHKKLEELFSSRKIKRNAKGNIINVTSA